jgi:hypothetical protein
MVKLLAFSGSSRMDKVVAVSSAMVFGAIRSDGHRRTLLAGIGCLVVRSSLLIPGAQVFNDAGELEDGRLGDRGGHLVSRLIDLAGKVT